MPIAIDKCASRTRLQRAGALALGGAAAIAMCVTGCTAPVAFGRTGETLARGGFRVSAALPVGFGPTYARLSRERPDGTVETGTYRDSLPAGSYTTAVTPAANHVFSKFFSVEAGGAISPEDGLEFGALFGLTRVAAEIRVGVLGRGHEPIALALSGAASQQLLLQPGGVEWRTGVDLSLRTGMLMPLVNVYLGYVPTRRYVRLPDLQGFPRDDDVLQDLAEETRNELRLTTPVGVALWIPSDTKPGAALSHPLIKHRTIRV